MSTFNEASHALVLADSRIRVEPPDPSHGAEMWRIAGESGELDLNSSYMYLVFARDFAGTSRVAIVDGQVVGFVLGYRRPEHPECLFVWQIAVDERHRGARVAARLLDDLITTTAGRQPAVTHVETTITADNTASRRLFTSFADRWHAPVQVSTLFDAQDFPDHHDAELLHRIGPFAPHPQG